MSARLSRYEDQLVDQSEAKETDSDKFKLTVKQLLGNSSFFINTALLNDCVTALHMCYPSHKSRGGRVDQLCGVLGQPRRKSVR